MKYILFFLLLMGSTASAQLTYYIRSDSVKIEKTGGSNELFIKNATRGINGVLTNVGGGKTQFIASRKVGDTLFIGKDTLIGFGGTTYIPTNLTPGFRLYSHQLSGFRPLFSGVNIVMDTTSNPEAITISADTTAGDTKLATQGDIQRYAVNRSKLGADFTLTNDSLFLKGDYVNVLDYGADATAGSSSRSAFQLAIATRKRVYVPKGKYLITGAANGDIELFLNANQQIFGDGDSSILYTTSNTRIIATTTGAKVNYLHFQGSGKATGLVWQSGVICSGVHWEISNNKFSDFGGTAQQNGGGGIWCAGLGASNTDGGRITNNTFYNNSGGVSFGSRGEYVTVSHNTFGSNTTAVGMGAGNLTIDNNIIHNNTYGVKHYDGTNDGHSIVSNNLINHNTYPLYIEDVTHDVGLQFSNNMIYFGTLKFINSNNIKISGGNIDQIDSVGIQNSRFLQRVGVFWGTTQGGGDIPVNIYLNGEDFAKAGEVRKDAATPNNWIKQINNDTVSYNGPMYHTGITPASSSSSDSVWVKTVGTGQWKLRAQSDVYGNLQQTLDAGSTLTSTETISVAANTLIVDGTVAPFAVNSTAGVAIGGATTSGIGVTGIATTGVGGIFSITPTSTNTAEDILQLKRLTSGTASAGIGGTIDFYNEDDNNTERMSARIESSLTDVTTSAPVGNIKFYTNNAGSITSKLSLEGNGRLILSGRLLQTQGADVASVAGAIAVGLDGNVFELTGTNAVTLISNLNFQNGAEITLIFTSTASLTDGTANSGADIGMELAGNTNFTGSADDVIKLILSEMGGVQRWREVSRSVN